MPKLDASFKTKSINTLNIYLLCHFIDFNIILLLGNILASKTEVY